LTLPSKDGEIAAFPAPSITSPVLHHDAKEKSMSWVYLFLASIFEIGWPIGFKLSQTVERKVFGIALAIVCMCLSGGLLWLAQKEISIGTAYAVWTGIGAAGTFLIGVWFFGDVSSLGRYLGVLLIVSGVVLLRFSH
jgi:quaternary ammonium compound-resistance protein SugE